MEKKENLISTIEKGKPREKIVAAYELAKLNDFTKMDVLIEELYNEDWEVKTDAAYYLGKTGWYPAIHKIGEMIVNEEMYDVKNVAIYALQTIGFPEGVSFIIHALKDESPELRDDARTTLYRMFGDKILPLLNPDEEEDIEDLEERRAAYTANALEISVWWANHEKSYSSGKAYFFGELSTPTRIFEKFLEEPYLSDAYLEQLEDITGQNFGPPSKKMIASWESWLSHHKDKFIEGHKYFYGHEI